MERPALTDLTEEESLFRATVRGFAEERLRPLAAEMDRDGAETGDLVALRAG
jgi:alkylation response protein AidB-like acyl-CoA dehydrogenase